MRINLNKLSENILKRRGVIKGFIPVIYFVFIVSFIMTYWQEFIFRGGFFEAASWIRSNFLLFLLNMAIIGMGYVIVLAVCRRMDVATGISGVAVILLASINHYKTLFKGDPLTFNDFRLINESVDILKNYDVKISWQIIFCFVMLVGIVIILRKKTVLNIKIKWRIAIIVVVIMAMIGEISFLKGDLTSIGLENITYHVSESYEKKGLLFGMIREINPKIKKPAEYNIDTMLQLVSENTEEQLVNSQELPNLIFVMNETFFDLNKVEEINLSQDIMPNMRRYQEEYIGGKLLTPVYGGNTCQVEYEVLTGYPVSNTGNRMGYTELINGEVDSIVSILKANDYRTVAIHPFSNTFFKRNQVFKWMGFDDITFKDDMVDPTYEGQYISDKYVYDLAIEKYEQNKEQPFFAHIVTMQNHGSYDYEYKKHGISILNSGLSDSATQAVETYANLIKEADQSLEYLIDYFENEERPTIIVFYGDHAPGALNQTYDELGINLLGAQGSDIIEAYSTPYLIWNNMGIEKKEMPYINAYRLGAMVLDMANINNDSYFNFLTRDDIPTSSNGYSFVNNTWVPNAELLEINQQRINEIWLYQYDRLFGKQISSIGGRID